MVMRALLAGESAVQVGDDAQLLAGATLAAFVEPDEYRAISTGLAEALHDSWDRDPIWSIPRVDPARLDGVVVDEKTYGASVAVGWT
jgi:hypothetical protein